MWKIAASDMRPPRNDDVMDSSPSAQNDDDGDGV